MKIGRVTGVVICVALICGIAIVWHIVHSTLRARQLAKDASSYRLCAEQGDAQCQFKMGSMYSQGKGVPEEYVEALRWYRKSAEQGYAKAQYSVSNMYHEGKGVPQDYVEAARWCRKAAEQGYARAQDGLGFLYLHGEGVQQDYAAAARWYRKSADQGYGDAQYDLAYMYYYGYGVPQDRTEANRLLQESAAQGNKLAQEAIGGKKVHLSTLGKSVIASKILLGSWFLMMLVTPRSPLKRTRKVVMLGLALCMLTVALDLCWFYRAGQLQSAALITALYLARHFLNGVVVAVLSSAAFPKSGKWILIGSAALFLAFLFLRIAICELRHIPVTLRLLCFVGFPIGSSITAVAFLWFDRRGRQLPLAGDGGVGISATTN